MKVMVRSAQDDLEAMFLAQAVEDNGGEVISIAYDGEHQRPGAMQPSSKFVLWARVKTTKQMADIDADFSTARDRMYK